MDKKYYFLKLNPSRADFAQTMTESEKVVMQQHVGYCQQFLSTGKLLAIGPVLDPKGVFGAAVMAVEDEKEVQDFIANDPAAGINQYEYHPMMALVSSQN